MREYPKGGLIGKTVHIWRLVQALQIPLYAANACYFIVLAVFPALLLFLGLLQYTTLEVERLTELLYGLLPEALLEGAEELILLTYDSINGTVVGVSAATVIWSASRGIYGVLTGLNAIYGVAENRGYVYTRLISVVYTLVFLIVLLLSLGLHIFGTGLLEVMARNTSSCALFPRKQMDFRVVLLFVLQTGFFVTMFTVLPNRKNTPRESVPGAMLASAGWLVFSRLYSVYVEHSAKLSNVYGSVYAIALSMLWLYCCMSIVFYGGALNVLLQRKRKA